MDALQEYRALRKSGRRKEAAEVLRRRISSLDPAGVAQAGRMLAKDLPEAFPEARPLSVLVLGQCTTSYLLPAITARCWEQGLLVAVREGGYDQVLQDLVSQAVAPDVVVLLPWHQRLLAADGRDAAARVADEMAFLEQAWAQVARLRSKLVHTGYDWASPGAAGFALSAQPEGSISRVRQVNEAVRGALPRGAFFLDLEAVSAWEGKERFYDDRNYHWLKQPFSPRGLDSLGRHIAAALRALATGRRKVLVLDLDNTLWGGVVGEAGPHGIAIGGTTEGEAFSALQKEVKRLKESGVVLAACSKNNESDAREPFEKNDQMILRLEDFAAFHASWDPKPARIREIARELNLGLDSFVFFDDNPAEREHVRAELPEVMVIEAPPEPALYARALAESLAFESAGLTEADAVRGAHYAAEAARRRLGEGAAPAGGYLASLEMKARIQPVSEANLDRVVDLITKTNQFNLTTRRHSRPAVEAMLSAEGSLCFAAGLADRFGDYGLISVVLGVRDDARTLRLDTWLMSCRAMCRTVEHFVMNHLARSAQALGYEAILGECLPTPKNTPVRDLLAGFGFERAEAGDTLWRLELSAFEERETSVSL
jgi:FkbH-like protein